MWGITVSSRLETAEQQVPTNGTVNDFALAGLVVKYQLNDAYVGLEYKFRIGMD
jgi:hypothetical protein